MYIFCRFFWIFLFCFVSCLCCCLVFVTFEGKKCTQTEILVWLRYGGVGCLGSHKTVHFSSICFAVAWVRWFIMNLLIYSMEVNWLFVCVCVLNSCSCLCVRQRNNFFCSMIICGERRRGRIYELILLIDCNKSWFGLSKPDIIPKLLPIPPTPLMLKPNFRSFCTTEWWRWPLEFWFTMCECWSWWCDCLLLCCCWADLISWFFIFSCSSRSRRAFVLAKEEKRQNKMVKFGANYEVSMFFVCELLLSTRSQIEFSPQILPVHWFLWQLVALSSISFADSGTKF